MSTNSSRPKLAIRSFAVLVTVQLITSILGVEAFAGDTPSPLPSFTPPKPYRLEDQVFGRPLNARQTTPEEANRDMMRQALMLSERRPRAKRTPLPEYLRDRRYFGTYVFPQGKSSGEARALQNRLATLMRKLDPKAPGRVEHYGWMKNTAHGRRNDVWFESWQLRIIDVSPDKSGGYVVRLLVCPGISCSCDNLTTTDYVTEEWRYRPESNQVDFLKSDAAVPHPNLQYFPLAAEQQ